MTSKLQVTVPKALAERYGLAPGDEIEWEPAGDAIRVRLAGRHRGDPATRLRLFDQATQRQRERDRSRKGGRAAERGWSREDLYDRGRPR